MEATRIFASLVSAHTVNYTDDFVICCKDQADKAMEAIRGMMASLKLTVNDDKTHLCWIPQERFDFLGYTIGRCFYRETGRTYTGTRPSKKSIKRMVDSITEETDRGRILLNAEYVTGLNRRPRTRRLEIARSVQSCSTVFRSCRSPSL